MGLVPWRDSKVLFFWVWIRPHQICHWAFVWDLAESIYDFDLIYVMYRGAQTAMHTENGIIDDHTEREEIKHVGEVLPDGWSSVFARALEIESVGLG
jgi:hypothetical protein